MAGKAEKSGSAAEGRRERIATVTRKTQETDISLSLKLDGTGSAEISTGVGFLDHMLTLLARHSLTDLSVRAAGDLHVDQHHLTENVGICFGEALRAALADKSGIRRYGWALMPMEESLVSVALDLGGRPFFVWHVPMPTEKVGQFDTQLIEEFWRAVSNHGLLNLHVRLEYGTNSHHVAEAVFKGVARALAQAVERDPRVQGVPSTKGAL
ncbi:MAG TPA: imidazoleglycerol-phosphate dehydratase HisB [Planctomycetaceae bacterium]|nr:imidazoleglycerol-phosphate dehydratase HisB [Planctomycetaceae bacterium]